MMRVLHYQKWSLTLQLSEQFKKQFLFPLHYSRFPSIIALFSGKEQDFTFQTIHSLLQREKKTKKKKRSNGSREKQLERGKELFSKFYDTQSRALDKPRWVPPSSENSKFRVKLTITCKIIHHLQIIYQLMTPGNINKSFNKIMHLYSGK